MSAPVQPPLRVETVDGTTSGRPITTIKVTNGDLSISGSTATIDTSGSGGGGSVTSITFSSPLTGGTITTSGTVGISQADSTTDGYLSSTDWNTFNNKGSGTIGGSIANTQVAYGSGANTIQGSANLTFDGTNLDVAGYVKSGTGVFDTDGTTDLTLQTNGGTNSGTIVIRDGAGQDIEITPEGAGVINLDGLKWPSADGSANQVLQTDGAGTLSFTDASGGGSPGGSDTQIQYNDGGSFGGATAITYTDTAGSEQLLIDDTSDQPLVKIVQQGTGAAFEVHDQATDTSIFAVDPSGAVLVGYPSGTGTALKFLVSGSAAADSLRAASDGSAGAPVFTRTNDTNTGFFFSAADSIGVASGGLEVMTIGSGDITQTLKMFGPDGGAGNPTFGFKDDTDTGIYRPATGQIGFSMNGSNKLTLGAAGEILIGGTAAGSSGQVLTSGGSGAAMSWADSGGGAQFVPATASNVQDVAWDNLAACRFYGAGYFTGSQSAGTPKYVPFMAYATGTVSEIGMHVATAASGVSVQVGIYDIDANSMPDDLLGSATLDASSTGTVSSTSITGTISLTKGETYYYAFCRTSTSDFPFLTQTSNANTYLQQAGFGFSNTNLSVANTQSLYDLSSTALPNTTTKNQLYASSNSRAAIGIKYS